MTQASAITQAAPSRNIRRISIQKGGQIVPGADTKTLPNAVPPTVTGIPTL
jgi:hypothetical protein